MQPKTYFGYLSKIAGNPLAVGKERNRLGLKIRQLIDNIQQKLTPEIIPGLIWHLNLKEFIRVAPLVGVPISNFSGQSRFLKALCAKVPFHQAEPARDPETDELLEACNTLWELLFHFEMIDDLRDLASPSNERHRLQTASLMSLLEAVQGEVTYAEQAYERIRRVFSPFSVDIIEPALGITTEDIINSFVHIRKLMAERLEKSARLMAPAQRRWKEYRAVAAKGASYDELEEFMQTHSDRHSIAQKIGKSIQMANQFLLFRTEDFNEVIGERGKSFLEAFSFVPGKINSDFFTPFDEDDVRKYPFAKISEHEYLLVDAPYSSFSPLYRLVDVFDTKQKMERLRKRRDITLENEAERLFTAVTIGSKVWRNYYLPIGKKQSLAERDLLIVVKDCIFVIESKARPLRSVKNRNDKLKLLAGDIRKSIQEGYNQAASVIGYLKTHHPRIELYDENGAVIGVIDTTCIHHFFPIVFLESYYGLIATELKHWITVHPDIGYPWVVDHDTVESIFLKIDSREKLRDFLIWRRKVQGVACNEDEAVFAGFFLQHGAVEMPDKAERVQLTPEYADIFEAEYFKQQGYQVEVPDETIVPPVFSSITRRGDKLLFQIDSEFFDSININTGKSRSARNSDIENPGNQFRVSRNALCPCGSGLKFKRCCHRI